MRLLASSLLLLPFTASAALWIVQSGGSTIGSTDPYYSPQFLTIDVGDQVRWENQSGTHNVNGTLSDFPSNPQGFTSGNTASGNWTYTFTFTIPGVYNYECDGNGHAATQFGTITVIDPTGVAEVGETADVRLSPIPAADWLTVDLGGVDARSITVINLSGEAVMEQGIVASRVLALDVSALKPSNYFLLITERDGRVLAKPFTKD
ncbi:MAG: hypothetical protein IPK70_02300 [Flavobacteriales bacterium]|jgi:plastocyanin|nr:hypothetical protein [Flavobacteriales bacterium]